MIEVIENIIKYDLFRIKCFIVFCVVAFGLFLVARRIQKVSYYFVILFTLIICLIPVFTVTYSEVQTDEKYVNLIKSDSNRILPGIVCWGDSLTAGADSDYPPYPSDMDDLLKERYSTLARNNISVPVYNLGVGGEDSINIVGRSGRIQFKVEGFSIPEEIVPVEITFELIEGKKVGIGGNGNFNGVNHCSISGVIGDISRVDSKYYFTRLEQGQRVEVPKGTVLITGASEKWDYYKTCVNIIFIGANGGYDDIEDLIHQQHAIIDDMANGNSKYLVITTTDKEREDYIYLEKAMLEEYGEKYLNLRDYLCADAIYDAGLIPNEQDLEQMKKGMVPESLRKDSIHYNEPCTQVVATCIYNKLIDLGYFAELDDYVQLLDEIGE